MTLAMPDSVNVSHLPAGYDAYLGYADGEFATAGQLAVAFPAARRVILTVTGATLEADGADVESGDLTPAGGAAWAARKLQAEPGSRPVLYASVSVIPALLEAWAEHSFTRGQVRLLSAHYGLGPHICGPGSCEFPGIDAEVDGTQWTDTYRTPAGIIIDMSMLRDDFFNQSTSETERLVQELGIVRQGDAGAAVRTVQGLCGARGHPVMIDGAFGPATLAVVREIQLKALITTDGIVGPQTWPVLLGVA